MSVLQITKSMIVLNLSSEIVPRTGVIRLASPLLALSGHAPVLWKCPLLGVKRTWAIAPHMSAIGSTIHPNMEQAFGLDPVWCAGHQEPWYRDNKLVDERSQRVNSRKYLRT
jgi:hypothetical protein